MLEFLLEIIAELTGAKKAPPPQPRRRTRPPGTSQTHSQAAPASTSWSQSASERDERHQPVTSGHQNFDDMVKQFFGMTDEDEPATPRSADEDVWNPWTREAEPVRPTAPQPVQPVIAAVPPQMLGSIDPPSTLSPPDLGRLVPLELEAKPANDTVNARTVAARLRKNPKAAREAFIYAEIFGPPLADRL